MLQGKTAIVTGGAGDLGNAMARQLAENGAQVVIWDIVPESSAQAAIERVRSLRSYRSSIPRSRRTRSAGC